MNKILLFTLLAAIIIVGTLQLGNLTFAQTPTIKEKIIKPTAVGPTDLWAYSSSISTSKINAVTDNPSNPLTTYITSSVNNQGQNFKYTHGLGDNTVIKEVWETWKGYKTNPSGTTKVRSFLQGPSISYNDLTDQPLSLTISEFTKKYPTNPTATTTDKSWTLTNFAATSFGWKQATATKPSFITEAWIVLRVIDGTAPTISNVPANIGPLSPTSATGLVVNYAQPTATDDVDVGAIPVTCTPISSSTFPIGVTTVNCISTDSSGNSAPASFTVTVIDNIPPVITAPVAITVEATALLTPIANVPLGQATATDNVDPSPVITNNAPATFPLGPTTVTWTATDFSGNSATANQLVTLVDTTAPTLNLPADITKAAASSSGATVTYSATATDAVDTTPTVSCNPSSGSTFPIGKTTVSCTASDDTGNTNSPPGTFNVHVITVTSSVTTVPIGGQLYFQVTDTGVTGSSVTIRVASPPDSPTNYIDVTLAATGTPGVFDNQVNPVLPVTSSSGSPNELVIAGGGFDPIKATYTIAPPDPRPSETSTVTVDTTVSGNVLGRGVTANDPIRWSSDRYVIETSGFLKVYVASQSGGSLATISATVESQADSTARTITLVEDAANAGTFTSQYAVTFTNTSPSDFSNPATPRLYAPVNNIVTARYPAVSPTLSATATIDSATIPTFGAVTVATANYNCGTGGDNDFDGICNTWETQSVSPLLAGIKVVSGSGQTYSYACRPQIDDIAGNTAGTPYSAHGTASPNTIAPGTGTGSSSDPDGAGPAIGGFFTSTNGCPDPLIRDAYFEIDYMNGHKPTREALAQFIQALATAPDPDGTGPILAGIKAHIQLDENLGFHRDLIPYDDTSTVGVVSYDVEQIKTALFGKSAERSGKTGTTLVNYLGEKRQVFHWVVSLHDLVGRSGSSGYSEILGNDAVISLGSFTTNRGTDVEFTSTLLHEEGHNWGLDHQGPSALAPTPINCAPNYLSIMNYLYQFPDIVTSRPLDFSRSALSNLNEINGLSESAGLGQATPTTWIAAYGPATTIPDIRSTSQLSAASNPVDWNRDGDSGTGGDTGVKVAVHNIPPLGCADSTLRNLVGQNDYAGLVMNFRGGSQFSDGVHTSLTYNTDRTSTAGFDPAGNAVHNAPFVKTITVPTAAAVNTAITLSGSIEDPGEPLETHTVTINWGDGTPTSSATLTYLTPEQDDETIRANINSLSHTYAAIGKYTISVTVQDSTGLSDTSSFPAYIMVYGTSGRLVSTSSVNTPAGADKLNPSFTGVTSFSFQPDWRSGTVPTGNFQLTLSDNSLVVSGTSYQWLYIKGTEAHFQGLGTATITTGGVTTTKTVGITGSAVDGNLSGGNGIDKVRIRIFDPLLGGPFDPGALIFDNMCKDFLGSTTDATQPSPLCVRVFEPANDATITLGGTVGINP